MRSKLRFVALALGFGAAFCNSGRAAEYDARYQAILEAKGKVSDTDQLHDLFRLEWAYQMDVSPETATYNGYPGGETRWTDQSPAAVAARRQHSPLPLNVLATIDRTQL